MKKQVRRERMTERERDCLEAVRWLTRAYGYPPTVREVCDELGLTSTNWGSDLINNLIYKGYLERHEGVSRSLKIVR